MRKLLLTLVGLLTCMSLMAADVNLNFVSNSYGITATTENQGSSTATSQDGVTVAFTKCGYKSGESVRVYQGSKITVSAPAGSMVTKITFSFTSNSYANITFDAGQEGSYSNNMWQYRIGLSSVNFSCTKASRIKQINVSLSNGGTYVAAPTFSPGAGEVDENTYIQLDCETSGATIYYSWENVEPFEIGRGTMAQAGTLWAYAKKDGTQSEKVSATYTMASTGGDDPVTPITGKGWQLVTSVSQLAVGDKVIIANQASAMAISTENQADYRNRVSVSFNDDKSEILNPSNTVMQFQVGGGQVDKWTFTTLNYAGTQGYLSGNTSDKNYCKINSTLSSASEASLTINANTGVASITFHAENEKTPANVRNVLSHNRSADRFSCYTKVQSNGDVYLYKWVEDNTPTDEKPAVPVVTTDNNVTISDGDEVTLPYGTKVTVTSAGASMLGYTIVGSETNDSAVESNTYTFTLTENVTCEFYGSNTKGDGPTVMFSLNVAKADLTVKFGSTEVAAGESYTVAEGTELTLTTTTGTTLTVFDENLEAVATIDGKSLKYTVTEDCILTFEATTPAAGTSTMIEEVLFVIDQNAYADAFTLVTSTDEITDRDEYVLMYTDKNGKNYAMANTYTNSENRYLSSDKEVTVSGNQLNPTDNTMIFTFVTIDGKRYLMVDNYGSEGFKYMAGRTGKNNYTDLKDEISDLGIVTATITENGDAAICFENAKKDSDSRYLSFNDASNALYFSLYTAQKSAKLYKREFAMPAPMEAHTDTHFVITSNGGTLYVKEFEGLKPGVEITPKAVHTALDGFVPVTGDWTKEKTLVEDYQTVEAYVEHKGRVSDILSINLHPDGTTTTGIENVGADVEGAVEYFNLQGMRISEPVKGQVVIRRQGAKVEKIAVR